MQLTDPCGHPKPLPVNRVDRPPVDGRCARAQGFVDAVPEADLPHERESVGQLETNFNAWLAIFRFGVRGLRAPDRVLPDDRPFRADRAPLEKTQDLTNHFLLCRDVLGFDGVRIAGLLDRRIFLTGPVPVEAGRVAVRAKRPAEELAHDRDRTSRIENKRRQYRRLVNTATDPDARHRDDACGELLR